MKSVLNMNELPGEVLICEDRSPERREIQEIATKWGDRFSGLGCTLTYRENPKNLGYDGNVREVLRLSAGRWIMLIGNDDLLLQDGVTCARRRVEKNPELNMFASAYLKFRQSGEHTIGVNRIASNDEIFTPQRWSSGVIVKAAGFLGGLIIKKTFAIEAATQDFDGTLYYQIYLAALAFVETGIGYISTPTVASRVGNPPLFGAAESERRDHRPGKYGASARAAMWGGILNIGVAVERSRGVPIVKGMRRELAGRQAFHVFELVAPQGRRELISMVRQFLKLGLFGAPAAWLLTAIGLILGKQSRLFFRAARSVQSGLFSIREEQASRLESTR